jgi:hypothetical protein
MFISDHNLLNHWDVMMKIAIERMLIRNPIGHEYDKDNKTRFNGKSIHTYVFDLHNQCCEEYEWDWDKISDEFTKQLIRLVCDAWFRKYSLDGGYLYDWCNHTITEMKKRGHEGNPFDNLITSPELVKPGLAPFVSDFFNQLRLNSKENATRKIVQAIVGNKKTFQAAYDKHVKQALELYFGITQMDESDMDSNGW